MMSLREANREDQSNLPWYRFGMVWMIIALPLVVVIASLITVSIAFDSAPVVIEKTNYESVTDKAEE